MKKKMYQASYPISEANKLVSEQQSKEENKRKLDNLERRTKRRLRKIYPGDWKTAHIVGDVVGNSVVFTIEGATK